MESHTHTHTGTDTGTNTESEGKWDEILCDFLSFELFMCDQNKKNKTTTNNLIDSVELQAISIKIYDYISKIYQA